MSEQKDLITARRNEPWREELRKAHTGKERMAIPRVKMTEVDPHERARSLTKEVNCGLTEAEARQEAIRCLDCANPSCMEGCPVSINIPSFIKNVERGDFAAAAHIIRESSSLPAVCGRVCPQEKQCEKHCIYTEKMKRDAVAIGYLERFVADYEREHGLYELPEMAPKNGKKIAVIGSGPAGLSFAGDMARWGYDVTVFEALHEVGGVLKYGIPEFRLPLRVVNAELKILEQMGVHFETNVVVGRTLSYEQLQEMGFVGIFVGSGAGLPNFMNIPGENLAGVMSSNEYLTRVNLMGAGTEGAETPIYKGDVVAVIGGGNTAMDSVRTALRLGAKRAMIVYRRSEEEMPARREEILHAKAEGVEFLTLHNPIEYEGNEKGKVCRMKLQRMELGDPTPDGRRKPVPIPGAIDEVDVDVVVVSIGVSPNPLIPRSFQGLEVSPKGTVIVNDQNQSSINEVYAGGDIVRGGATVILAMGDGRKAAANMHAALSQQ